MSAAADEFDQILDRGIFDAATGARVRAEAAAVLARLEANGPPFGDGWDRWRPDPAWPTPQLPAGWDELPREVGPGTWPQPAASQA